MKYFTGYITSQQSSCKYLLCLIYLNHDFVTVYYLRHLCRYVFEQVGENQGQWLPPVHVISLCRHRGKEAPFYMLGT